MGLIRLEQHGQEVTFANVEPLTDFSWRMRQAVNAQGLPEVDVGFRGEL